MASTVTVVHRRGWSCRSRVSRVTWRTWAAWGNPKWWTKMALRVRTSMRPWPRSRGVVQLGDAVPGQALVAVQQGGLVGLHHEQVVGVLAGDQELGGLGVGLQRVGGDHHVGEVEWGQ
jgi:hypothetical protein